MGRQAQSIVDCTAPPSQPAAPLRPPRSALYYRSYSAEESMLQTVYDVVDLFATDSSRRPPSK